MLQIPLKIIDLQNDFNILVAKQWKINFSVPMSYIRLFENPAVLEKWYGMQSRSVMEPAVLLLVSLPCTIGIELRSRERRFLWLGYINAVLAVIRTYDPKEN